mmetsp:Transcript_26168/g.46424  ORF Transcript_26168/g.46424 Transcript_26168/m.46424 type:complete len:152 (-) Transcript_26168:126-581(-)
MMLCKPNALFLFTVALLQQQQVSGFALSTAATPTTPATTTTTTTLFATHVSDRRAFLDMASLAAGSLLISQPVFADDSVDDLSMPSEDEIKKAEADAAAERLRIKAELQKKNAKPMGFADSLAAEKEKQRQLQKSKEERRNALCEELGRGC